MSRISSAIGSTIVAPIVDVLDINGVVRRVDLDDALSRIDLDALLDRVDWDRILDRIDVNRHLMRVDMERLVERSNISAIVARSSSGIFGVALDTARAQLVKADGSFQRLGRCACCQCRCHRKRKKQKKEAAPVHVAAASEELGWELPPKPGKSVQNEPSVQLRPDAPSPPSSPQSITLSYVSQTSAELRAFHSNSALRLALDAQGRYAGILVRFIANFIDKLIILIIFTMTMLLVETLVNRFQTNREKAFDPKNDWPWYPIFFYLWTLLYTAGSLAATGRTIGLTIIGLKVIKSTDGTRVGPLQALIRTSLEPLSAVTVVGLLMGWIRRDGKQLHDLLACTGVVYSWDAKLAYLRQQAIDAIEEKQSV